MNPNKKHLAIGFLAAVLLGRFGLPAAEQKSGATYEYATIRWDGRDNTHIVRPGGRVEFVTAELRKANRPDRTDERTFYLNLVMNGLAQEGFEFSGMTQEQIVMQRPLVR